VSPAGRPSHASTSVLDSVREGVGFSSVGHWETQTRRSLEHRMEHAPHRSYTWTHGLLARKLLLICARIVYASDRLTRYSMKRAPSQIDPLVARTAQNGVDHFARTPTPTIVFLNPSGARAASRARFFLAKTHVGRTGGAPRTWRCAPGDGAAPHSAVLDEVDEVDHVVGACARGRRNDASPSGARTDSARWWRIGLRSRR
jgi:hypothetical protein